MTCTHNSIHLYSDGIFRCDKCKQTFVPQPKDEVCKTRFQFGKGSWCSVCKEAACSCPERQIDGSWKPKEPECELCKICCWAPHPSPCICKCHKPPSKETYSREEVDDRLKAILDQLEIRQGYQLDGQGYIRSEWVSTLRDLRKKYL